jgi:hypothetical protein
VSFNVFFQPCRFDGEPIKKTNRLTGEEQLIVPNGSLTPAEESAIRAVLTQANAEGPDDFECYVVRTEDGGGAEIFARDLAEGCMVNPWELTPRTLELLFNLLKAGNWVMLPAMEGDLAITTS